MPRPAVASVKGWPERSVGVGLPERSVGVGLPERSVGVGLPERSVGVKPEERRRVKLTHTTLWAMTDKGRLITDSTNHAQ